MAREIIPSTDACVRLFVRQHIFDTGPVRQEAVLIGGDDLTGTSQGRLSRLTGPQLAELYRSPPFRIGLTVAYFHGMGKALDAELF